FARLLGPSCCKKGEQTFVTLKSALLDHPAASAPMSKKEVDFFKGVLKKFEESKDELRAKYVNEEVFIAGEKHIANLSEALVALDALTEEGIDDFCKNVKNNFNIEVQNRELSQLQAELKPMLEQARNEAMNRCFEKVHPGVFTEMEARVESANKYFNDCEQNSIQPTMTGVTFSMYPDLEVFITVFGRSSMAPFGNISLAREGYRSLEGIRDLAIKNNLATPDEVAKMNQSLENFRQKAFETSMVSTTVELDPSGLKII
ncbi:MAG: hypothetical protein JSR46_07385, partial [Verrucomicrobia bacterium]|nr:hypothetical protein [Verrucomicrobiota bacterium]